MAPEGNGWGANMYLEDIASHQVHPPGPISYHHQRLPPTAVSDCRSYPVQGSELRTDERISDE